jgi:hypothetical protein
MEILQVEGLCIQSLLLGSNIASRPRLQASDWPFWQAIESATAPPMASHASDR